MVMAALALALGGCGRGAGAPDAAGVDAVVVDAVGTDAVVVDAAPAPRPARRPNVALPSGEVAWGVAIPIGCTPVFARAGWVEARCRLSYRALRKFFAYRFPGGRSTAFARGERFDPGTSGAGHAVMTPFAGDDGVRSRLMIFAGPRMDDGARALVERLVPAALRGE